MVQTLVDNRILKYTKNIIAASQDLDNGNLMSRIRVDDALVSARLEIEIKPPELKIVKINGEINHILIDECKDMIELLQKTVGMRIGSGVTKMINETIGGSKGCPLLADMILEGFNAIIMHFTVDELDTQLAADSNEVYVQAMKDMLEQNPRVGSCIAFVENGEFRRCMGV